MNQILVFSLKLLFKAFFYLREFILRRRCIKDRALSDLEGLKYTG